VIALAALALTGTALAASMLELVPGVRIQQMEELPELPFTEPPSFGAASTIEDARRAIPYELVLPDSLGDPDEVFLDRDLGGAPIVTAVYGSAESARLILTQWPAESVLFHKLLTYDASARFVDVHGASGIWIEGSEHAVFYLGTSRREERVAGYLGGNVLVWERGPVSYRLEAGVELERALELAGSLRPLG
jgi:hypothetical protein